MLTRAEEEQGMPKMKRQRATGKGRQGDPLLVALLAEAQKKIKSLSVQLEKTERRKEAAREKQGKSRYHSLIKQRAMEALKAGMTKAEVSAWLGVGLGALDVWAQKPKRSRV